MRRSAPLSTRSVSSWATDSVGVPLASPGNTLARFLPSSGLSRVVVSQAAGCAGAAARTVPLTSTERKCAMSQRVAMTPSYSSPCTPPSSATIGPADEAEIVTTCGEWCSIRADYGVATTRERCSPRPSIPRRISSPTARYRGGRRPSPTPEGVPVLMTSPGSRTMN